MGVTSNSNVQSEIGVGIGPETQFNFLHAKATLEQTWFTRSEKGVYWLDANIRGEGVNLADYASRTYGLAFGTEMGMYGSFEHRVSLGMLTVQTMEERSATSYLYDGRTTPWWSVFKYDNS